MTRVLHYGLGVNKGGIEMFLLDLARRFDESEFSFDFVYNDVGADPCFKGELTELGARFYPVTPRRVSPRRNAEELTALFGSGEFGLFHAHINTLSYLTPIRAALRHGVPTVVHSHNAGASTSIKTNLLHHWQRRAPVLKRTKNLAVSRPAGQWLFGVNTRHEVIPNGIRCDDYRYEPETRKLKREELGLDDDLVVGHVGAFLPAKNHAMVIRIFQALLELRENSRLLLVGAGPLEDQVRRQVRKAGIDSKVDFLGTRNDVPQLLNAMDALLLPSLHEGFPLIALEGQASGLPCFLSDSVTDEVNVTNRVHMIKNDAPPKAWASTLIELAPRSDREGAAAELQRAGFEASRVSMRLEEIYRGLIL